MSDINLEKRNERKRKSASLTTEEWLTFFFLPFFTPKPKHRDDHFSQSELDRFKKYGFETKYKQAYKVKFYGFVFWTMVIVIAVVFIAYFQ